MYESSSDLVGNSDYSIDVLGGHRILGKARMETKRQWHGGPDRSSRSSAKVKRR